MSLTRIMKSCRYILATAMFIFVLMIGTVCFAYPETPGTVLGESCNIRETADTNGRVLGSAKKGATVSIVDEVTGTDGKVWYQIFVDANTKGFIRADLVKKNDNSTDTTTSSALPATQVTPVDAKAATVVTNNVRIRKGASTQYDYVATANKGMTLTVNGEATGSDGKLWYQVVFNYNNKEITGFVRNDLVSFGTVPADTVSSEITGTTETPAETMETPQTEEPEEQETTQEPEQETNANQTQVMTLMNVEETPYLIPGFVPIILKWENQDINAFKNGSFYIFYAQNQNGEQGWYVFDSSLGTYQRYAYTVEGVSSEDANSNSVGMLPVFILAVVIVILLIVIGLLLIRLREYTSEEYDEEEDTEEEEELDEAEAEVVEDEMQRERRNLKKRPAQPISEEEAIPQLRQEEETSVRRPQTAQRPVRKQPQNRVDAQNQRPVRRPEGSDPVRRDGDRPVRNQNGEMPKRRPEGMGQGSAKKTSGQPNQRRANRPEQQGYKAQSFIENEDQNDLEFIDL